MLPSWTFHPRCVASLMFRPSSSWAVFWAAWFLFTGVHALCVVLRVRCPWRLGSCSRVCTISVWCCVRGVHGRLAPVHRCACFGVLCRVYGVLGPLAPVHWCARFALRHSDTTKGEPAAPRKTRPRSPTLEAAHEGIRALGLRDGEGDPPQGDAGTDSDLKAVPKASTGSAPAGPAPPAGSVPSLCPKWKRGHCTGKGWCPKQHP